MPRSPVVLSLIEDALSRLRVRHEDARTRRILAELPHHVRKDIGWPDALPDRRRTRRDPAA